MKRASINEDNWGVKFVSQNQTQPIDMVFWDSDHRGNLPPLYSLPEKKNRIDRRQTIAHENYFR